VELLAVPKCSVPIGRREMWEPGEDTWKGSLIFAAEVMRFVTLGCDVMCGIFNVLQCTALEEAACGGPKFLPSRNIC
jgi:hypothetical protein